MEHACTWLMHTDVDNIFWTDSEFAATRLGSIDAPNSHHILRIFSLVVAFKAHWSFRPSILGSIYQLLLPAQNGKCSYIYIYISTLEGTHGLNIEPELNFEFQFIQHFLVLTWIRTCSLQHTSPSSLWYVHQMLARCYMQRHSYRLINNGKLRFDLIAAQNTHCKHELDDI